MNGEKVVKDRSRADEILMNLAELEKKTAAMRKEAATLAELVAGDRPKDVEENMKKEKPTNLLAALEYFVAEITCNLRGLDGNLDFVKENLSVDGFKRVEG